MITRLEEISVTKESYPFASAERYLKLSERGYVEKEYYCLLYTSPSPRDTR